MKNIITILKRELGAYFTSAIAYIYLIVFIAINNSLFMTRYFFAARADMKIYFDNLPFMLFIFIPVISMRLWAEDKREHTFELLLTLPMKPYELVLGKFLSGFIFYCIALASTFTIPVILFMTGSPDMGAIFGGYLGAILTGMLCLSIGIFISGLVNEQIVAFVLTTVSCFFIYFLGTDFIASFIDGWIPGLGTFLLNHVGAASHAISFGKGVIAVRDIFYFVVLSAVFLLLNGFSLEGRFRPKARIVFGITALVCAVGVISCNWLIYDFNIGRFDITENKIYTVSAAAKNIFKELKAPVTLNFYITPVEKMPTALKSFEQELTGKLQELKVASGGKFVYKVFHIEAANLMEQKNKQDTVPEKEEVSLEKSLQDKGIFPFQVESIDKDEVGLKLIYSAITIGYKEKKEEVFPRILPQNLPDLEYLFFSRVKKLMQETKPKIAIFSPLQEKEIPFEMSRILSGMGKDQSQYEDEYKNVVSLVKNNGYEVSRISLTENDTIASGTKILLIFNPDALSDRQLFEINKFLFQGGSVLLAGQGLEYSFQIVPPQGLDIFGTKKALGINKLIGKWGVRISEEMLMDENTRIIEINTGQKVGPFALSTPVKAPNQIVVSENTMNKDVPFVMRLPSLFYLWGSSLDISDDVIAQAKLKKTVIFTSSPRSWKAPFEGGSIKKELLSFPKTGSSGNFVLGVSLEGQFTNTFEGQELPDWPAAKEPSQTSAEQPAIQPEQAKVKQPEKARMQDPLPGNLIVLGCAKMFNDDLISFPGNLNLFGNIIDGLALGSDIISLRSKIYTSREIKKVTDNKKVFYRFIAILLIPSILVSVAFLRIFLRKKEKEFYLKARERA